MRISILPTAHGEKIVIRILDKASLTGSIDQLGMDEDTLEHFRKAIDAPHGMILVTGPTGSGKTTTLYSVLQELNNPKYNIVTVEDPIEYELMGVNQVAVRSDIGLDFASALRSILRQDPDIVMVGEIRDNETADIAVKAALTGHQVLSTLHTNDAAGAITRLDDMGIEPFLISSSILMTCAQRLVRRICTNCQRRVCPGAGDVWSDSGCKTESRHGFLSRHRLRSLQRPRLSRPGRDYRSAASERNDSAADHQARLGRGHQESGDHRRDENSAHGRHRKGAGRQSPRWKKSGASPRRITRP